MSYFIQFFMIAVLIYAIPEETLAFEMLDEIVYESDSHKGIVGKYKFTTRLIHEPRKINEYTNKFKFPQVMNEEPVEEEKNVWSKPNYHTFGMGEKMIVQEKDTILYTSGLVDCIGISGWDPHTQTAALAHGSKMELGKETKWMFQEGFIDKLKEKVKKAENVDINLVSSYWSQDLVNVIELLQTAGFNIKGLSIPEATIEYEEFTTNIYINKEKAPENYHKLGRGVHATMAINTKTGKVGFERSKGNQN